MFSALQGTPEATDDASSTCSAKLCMMTCRLMIWGFGDLVYRSDRRSHLQVYQEVPNPIGLQSYHLRIGGTGGPGVCQEGPNHF